MDCKDDKAEPKAADDLNLLADEAKGLELRDNPQAAFMDFEQDLTVAEAKALSKGVKVCHNT